MWRHLRAATRSMEPRPLLRHNRSVMSRRAAPILVALLVGACAAEAAEAAAPRLIMVSGPPLSSPVTLSNWNEIGSFVQAVANESPAVGRASLTGRPSLLLALFWDARIWEPYVRQGRLASLRPDQANQFGRFYPATDGRPAAIDLPWAGRWPKQLNAAALAILERHGVPVDTGGDDAIATWWWVGAGVAGAVLIGAAIALPARRRITARSETLSS